MYLSLVNLWKIQIKYQLGKLKLETELKTLIEAQQQTNTLQILEMKLEHIYTRDTLNTLPSHHREPFDRMLISQAMAEQIT